MATLYLDGYAVEYVFTEQELADALAYWRPFGSIEVRQSANVIRLA